VDIMAARVFPTLFIWLDCAWLAAFAAILAWRGKYRALAVGLLGGVLYMLVDYGIFYLALRTRAVSGASPFWLLLWLSMSYGFTNMAWAWLLLDRDGNAVEWSLLVVAAWLAVGLAAAGYGGRFPTVRIQRGTGSYHGAMAILLAVGYGILIVRNLAGRRPRVSLLRLLAIGVGIQLGWELVLLLSGIRPASIVPLVVNSLLETNLGMPYLFLIHEAVGRVRGGTVPRATEVVHSS
jgi:hypothetical protein